MLACPDSPCASPANAGSADIKGVELEFEAHPIERLTLAGSVSNLKFKYTSFSANTGIPVGSTAPGTIRDKFSVAAQYEIPVGSNGATITPRFDYSFQGGFNTNAVPTAGNRVNGYHLGNARITWKSGDDRWQVSAIGTNIFDKYYYNSVFDLTTLGGGSNYGFVAPPREYSLQIQKRF